MKCDSTTQHSHNLKRNVIKTLTGLLFGVFFVSANVVPVEAQMFSVGDQGLRFNVPQSEVYLGLESMDVAYQGDMELNEAEAFEFEGSIIRLGYDSPGFNVFLGTGGTITGIDNISYFDTGGNVDFGLSLYSSRQLSVLLPLRIASRYTNITNNRAFQFAGLNRFRFGSISAGAGVNVRVRPLENFRFKAGVVPHYGFAFASGGFFGGSLGAVSGNGRLYFDHLFGDVGLAIGYNYDLRNYDIDEDIYDYRINGHSLEVGITF